MFSTLYSPDVESSWLHYATYLLLSQTTRSPDFERYVCGCDTVVASCGLALIMLCHQNALRAVDGLRVQGVQPGLLGPRTQLLAHDALLLPGLTAEPVPGLHGRHVSLAGCRRYYIHFLLQSYPLGLTTAASLLFAGFGGLKATQTGHTYGTNASVLSSSVGLGFNWMELGPTPLTGGASTQGGAPSSQAKQCRSRRFVDRWKRPPNRAPSRHRHKVQSRSLYRLFHRLAASPGDSRPRPLRPKAAMSAVPSPRTTTTHTRSTAAARSAKPRGCARRNLASTFI